MAINLNATINNVSENVKLLTDRNWNSIEQRLSVVDNYSTDIAGKADKTYVDEKLAEKQDAFGIGTGLTQNSVDKKISVITGEISEANTTGYVTGRDIFVALSQKADSSLLSGKQDALTPGNGVTITNNTISLRAFVILDTVFDTSEVQDFDENRDAAGRDVLYLNKTAEGKFNMYVLASDVVGQRPTFRPVGCIATKVSDLVNDASYATIGDVSAMIAQIDRSLFRVVDALPTSNIDASKIYLLSISEEEGLNTFEEYIYTGKWERIGTAELSLDGYLTIESAAETYLTKVDAANTYQPKGSYLTPQSIIGKLDADAAEQLYQHKGEYLTAQDIAGKADASVVYTKEMVDAIISQYETRLAVLESRATDYVVASSATELQNVENAETKDVLLKGDEAMAAVNGTTFKNMTVVGAGVDSSNIVSLSAVNDLVVDGLSVDGEKKEGDNGKVHFAGDTVNIKNVTIENGCAVYNIFEGIQDANRPVSEAVFSNIKCIDPALKHNVINIYAPAENAVITVKDSSFSLDVDNSNILRLANIANASNVTVNLENIDWTYEDVEGEDFAWAGLVIYQPYATDVAFVGDISKTSTWTFNIKNCRYNGVKVTANNFGQHNQVVYTYRVNNQGIQDADTAGFTLNFE